MNRFASTYLIAQGRIRTLLGKLIGLGGCVCHRSPSKTKKGLSVSLALVLIAGSAPLIASAHELEERQLVSTQDQLVLPGEQPVLPQDQPVPPTDEPVSPKDNSVPSKDDPLSPKDQSALPQSGSSQDRSESLQNQSILLQSPTDASQNPSDSLQPQDLSVGATFKGTITIGGVARDCTYKVIGDGTSVQVGDDSVAAVDVSIPGDIAIPNAIVYQGKTYAVTALGAHAFMDCTEITSTGLEWNDSVTSIGSFVFSGCKKLVTTGLESNSSVSVVPPLAFASCTSLATTGLGSNSTVGTVDSMAFYSCSGLRSSGLESNSTITRINSRAFYDCAGLSGDLVLSSSVHTIGASAFNKTGYARVYLLSSPDRVKVGNNAFLFTGGYSPLYVPASWEGTPSLQTDSHTYSTADGSLVVMAGQSLSDVSALRLSPFSASVSFTPSKSGSARILAEDESVLWSGAVTASTPVQTQLDVDAASHDFWVSSPGPVYPADAAPTSYNVGPTANAAVSLAAHSYAVVFDGNQADEGAMADQVMNWDVPTVLHGNGYSRDGYLFAGWNTQADGSGTAYSDGQTVSQLTLDASLTLYAQWTAEPVTPPVGPSPSDASGGTPGAPGSGSDVGVLGGGYGVQVATGDGSLSLIMLLAALAAVPIVAMSLWLLRKRLMRKTTI